MYIYFRFFGVRVCVHICVFMYFLETLLAAPACGLATACHWAGPVGCRVGGRGGGGGGGGGGGVCWCVVVWRWRGGGVAVVVVWLPLFLFFYGYRSIGGPTKKPPKK